jgi:hypothetical protein
MCESVDRLIGSGCGALLSAPSIDPQGPPTPPHPHVHTHAQKPATAPHLHGPLVLPTAPGRVGRHVLDRAGGAARGPRGGADAWLRLDGHGVPGRDALLHAAQHQDHGRVPPRVPHDVRPGHGLLHRGRAAHAGQHRRRLLPPAVPDQGRDEPVLHHQHHRAGALRHGQGVQGPGGHHVPHRVLRRRAHGARLHLRHRLRRRPPPRLPLDVGPPRAGPHLRGGLGRQPPRLPLPRLARCVGGWVRACMGGLGWVGGRGSTW